MQDVYQQTHPILFSDRAIYMVLYSMRSGISEATLTQHVLNITTRARNARILLVATHADQVAGSDAVAVARDVSLSRLKDRFPQV